MTAFTQRVIDIIKNQIPTYVYDQIINDQQEWGSHFDVGGVIRVLLENEVFTTNLTKFEKDQSCVFAADENLDVQKQTNDYEVYAIGGDWESGLIVVIYITPDNQVDMFIPDNTINGRIGLFPCDVQNDWEVSDLDLMADIQGTEVYSYLSVEVDSVDNFVDFVKKFNDYEFVNSEGMNMSEYLCEIQENNFTEHMSELIYQFTRETANGTLLSYVPKTMKESFTMKNSKWWKHTTDWLIYQYVNKTFSE